VVMLLSAAPGTSGLVLLDALTTAFESATPPPFTFAIGDAAHGLAAGGAAETRPVTDRQQGRFMATWSTAAGRRQNNCCCVTTRRRIRRGLCWLRQRSGTLPARTLGLGVLSFGRGVEPASGLPLRCLPEAEQAAAVGVLAVTLVPASRLVLAAAALAQAESRPRLSRPGTALALGLMMTTAHGRSVLPRDSPGGTR